MRTQDGSRRGRKGADGRAVVVGLDRGRGGWISDLLRAFGVGGLLFALFPACGGSEDLPPPNPACQAEVAPEIPGELRAKIRGSVRIVDRRDFTAGDGGQPVRATQGIVQADFGDFSSVTSTPSALMPLGEHCIGVISRPTRSGTVRRLDLSSLTLQGAARADLRVMRTAAGVFSTIESDLLQPGASMLRIVGETTEGGFPSFDEALAPVDAMALIAPASDARAELVLGELSVAWTPGNGDYVEVSIVPEVEAGKGSGGGQAICFVTDDGCFIVPGQASAFLLASQAAEYTLSVERFRYRALRPDGESSLEIEVISEWKTTLLNGVIEL